MIKPNFFIVGAAKSGTSTLYSIIAEHPEVFMSQEKEPSYFVANEDLACLWPDMANNPVSYDEHKYLELFEDAGGARVVGESSTTYSMLPFSAGVAQRIYDFNPESKILFVLRNPVKRAISHYWHRVKRGREDESMQNAITLDSIYMTVSDYATQIEDYYKHFNNNNVNVITLESFSMKPDETIKNIFRWLEIDAESVPENLHEQKHVTPKVVRRQRNLGLLGKIFLPAYKAAKPAIPLSVHEVAKNLFMPKVDRSAVESGTVVKFLEQAQRKRNEKLCKLLDREFPEWEV
ncbi:MAG: sulfotransferase domain-containing protein [Candidatus Thiodiazotropha sp. (ex Codakia orbicularis)]|nr:sulfotransferase domain-containing protein [Candidatus Thiodiazotropha sp. (ex Codakia orbicularis)]